MTDIDWDEARRNLAEALARDEYKHRRRYVAEYTCPECGEAHRFGGELRLDPPPGRRGTVARLCPDPLKWDAVITALMCGCAVWCETAGDYLSVRDPERVVLIPWTESGRRFGWASRRDAGMA